MDAPEDLYMIFAEVMATLRRKSRGGVYNLIRKGLLTPRYAYEGARPTFLRAEVIALAEHREKPKARGKRRKEPPSPPAPEPSPAQSPFEAMQKALARRS